MIASRFFPEPKSKIVNNNGSNNNDEIFHEPSSENAAAIIPKTVAVVAARNRKGFIPRSQKDFGDGGAYPEVHVAQFPLGSNF